jgi:hypothetical protein
LSAELSGFKHEINRRTLESKDIILLPQDTTLLLDVLPMTPASLPNVVRVVWTGKSSPDRDGLRSQFTVRKDIVYNALQWLQRHNEHYQNITIIKTTINLSFAG